jgi:hypothetical protein
MGDPFGDGSYQDHLPSDATKHVPTPSTGARSSSRTHVQPRPRDRPFDPDPFADDPSVYDGRYVDEETGEPFKYTPGELPTVMTK